jgi:hypothetical protein
MVYVNTDLNQGSKLYSHSAIMTEHHLEAYWTALASLRKYSVAVGSEHMEPVDKN